MPSKTVELAIIEEHWHMDLKAFGKYLQGKSLSYLLHRARRKSLKRIQAQKETLDAATPKKPAQKRTGTR